MTTHNNKA